jgi:hypothetical protein
MAQLGEEQGFTAEYMAKCADIMDAGNPVEKANMLEELFYK